METSNALGARRDEEVNFYISTCTVKQKSLSLNVSYLHKCTAGREMINFDRTLAIAYPLTLYMLQFLTAFKTFTNVSYVEFSAARVSPAMCNKQFC